MLLPTLLLTLAPAQTPCGDWTVTPVPFDAGWNRARFNDVTALPNGEAWAAGSAQLPTPPFGPEDVTLVMHWDGQTWSQQPTPYVAAFQGGANDHLHAVAALAPDDVWAAGERHGDAGGLSVGAWLHVLHYDGSDWEVVPPPPPPGGAGINFSGPRVYDIAAFASDDVWFAGQWGEPNSLATVTWRPLAMHWDGSNLTVHDTPTLYSGTNAVHMRSMSALAPDDIWGICNSNTAGRVTVDPLVLHYDGSDWSQVSMPDLSSSQVLNEVVAIAPDDVWIFGHYYFPSSPFALHWDGGSWTLDESVPFATTAAALGTDEIYLGTSVITLFDGTSSTVVETFPAVNGPSVLGMEAGAGCAMWAVGREFSAPTGDLAPFAARLSGSGALGAPYCTALPNSTGAPASLSASGSASVADGDFTLIASSVPDHPGLFFFGPGQQEIPFGNGFLCVTEPIVRIQPPAAATGHTAVRSVDLPSFGITAGTRDFQYWYRDPAGGGAFFNLSNGLEVVFAP